jgi:hypothetical protein
MTDKILDVKAINAATAMYLVEANMEAYSMILSFLTGDVTEDELREFAYGSSEDLQRITKDLWVDRIPASPSAK